MEQYLWLIPVGFGIGAFGTLIGAGGGFILVPLLILLYPEENPEIITSISLAVVFFNALSGSLAYGRLKRIDYKSGLIFSAAAIPGAVLGALTTSYLSRRFFDSLFGILMIGASVYLLFRPRVREAMKMADAPTEKSKHSPNGYTTRSFIDADGLRYDFSFNPVIGVGLSLFVGYVSSLLGIGGGFIHVPALVHLLNFPVHVATATSHFILSIMAFTGTAVHILTGAFYRGLRRTITLSIGVVLGAQLGAWLSNRVQADWIMRGLAIALGFVGIRILAMVM